MEQRILLVLSAYCAPLANVVFLTMLHDRGNVDSSIPFKLCCGVQLLDDTSVIDVLGLVLNEERIAAVAEAAV